MSKIYGEHITIEVVKGGFILTYPAQIEGQTVDSWVFAREVFSSYHKLNKKLKEVIELIDPN